MAMTMAFQEVFDPNNLPDIEFILRLHKLSLSGVKGTENYDKYDDKPGDFRDKSEEEFVLNKNCCGELGIKEFLDRAHPQLAIELNIYQNKRNFAHA